MIERKITLRLKNALGDNPVVLLHGARQTGKSTLIKHLIETGLPANYVTLDDAGVLSAAQNDPHGFLQGYEGCLAIDEVQRVPEIFRAMKKLVDNDRKPGKYLLTGSANIMLVPKLSESLAGRIEILHLYPFSQNEISGSVYNFVDDIFSKNFKISSVVKNINSLSTKFILGGYPEIQNRENEERRNAWFKSYITTILQRDVRDLANIEKLSQLPRLLHLFASRAGTLLNFAELSRSAAIPQTTLKRYISLLEATFMIYLLPAWSGNLSKRLIKTPKVYLTDTGLLSHLTGFSKNRIQSDALTWGRIVENFVLMEIIKQVSWSNNDLSIYYFRTSSGQEVDFIIERNDGSLVCIEVKASASVNRSMFNNIQIFAGETKKKFLRGIVLYTGNEAIPFANNLFALPISILWK